MRSLLITIGIILFIVLALGSGLTLASASSEPGMFLYPLKQTTQRLSGATEDPAQSLPPAFETSEPGAGQQPSASLDTPSEEIQEDAVQKPDISVPDQVDAATASPAPTPVRVVDEITVTAEPGEVPSVNLDSIENLSSPPALGQLESSSNDNQPENSNSGDLHDGQPDKGGGSNNDNSHSESNHENKSNDNGKDDD